MRYHRFYLVLSILTIFILSFPLQARSELDGQAVVHLPLLAANQERVEVQVSSFRERLEAENEAARLASLGVGAFIRHESVQGKGKWYRVYAGRFRNTSQASKYARTLKARGVISWFWIKSKSLSSVSASDTTTPQDPAVRSTGVESIKPSAPQQPSVQLSASSAEAGSRTPAKKQDGTSALQGRGGSSPPSSAVAVKVAAKGDVPDKMTPAVRLEGDRPKNTGTKLDWNPRFKSQTTLRAFERDTANGNDTLVAPLYQYLQLDFGDAEAGGWAMHFYGWGRYDLADSSYYEDTADGELLHGYLEYSKPYSPYRLALGRQHIFAGVTNETVDGVQAAAGIGEVISAMVFGGVTAGSKESSADTTYGGRLAVHPQPHYELAISYQDTDLEGLPDQRVGADLSFNWSDWLTVQGLSSYNLDREDWREHNYSAAMRYKDFILEPAYQFFSYEDYFGAGNQENNLFNFLKDTKEQVTIVGGDVQYQGDTPVRLAGRYNQYTYDLRQEDAAYYAALVRVDLPDGSQLGGEAGRMDGETADNIYTLYRAYFHWANPLRLGSSTFFSGDVVLQDYDAPVFGEDSATHYSLSGGMHFFDEALEVRLTGLYSQDPYFDENVEGVLTFRINY